MASDANVFISYASDTRNLAEELAQALERQGLEPWIDFKDLHPGQRWKDEVDRAIDAAQWFVIIVGPDSRATHWQEAEWSAVLARTWTDSKKKVLPVVLGDGAPPPFLRNWVSLRIDPHTASWTHQVLDALRNPPNEPFDDQGRQNRAEREKRLDEVRKAAEELRSVQPEEPPSLPEAI